MVVCMNSVAEKTVTCYLSRTLSEEYDDFSAPYLSKQLAAYLFSLLPPHRAQCPSALCEKHSLFALLEILTVMWTSCLQGELDEFEWKPTLVSPMGIVKVGCLITMRSEKSDIGPIPCARARTWVTAVLNIAPLDIKGLLRTYLSEYDDDGYGHIALGRSFAIEMGSLIPQSDPRLGSIGGLQCT
ncbi:Phosphatidylinositol Kinase [Penicillium pulvis]|uniref:Phosphatidylinositol Kinase n=1 Tax=Penicillium pulvis TaxID=1562058 RepID=UPI0025465C12|nr:Phosphatidylinositol Kinase [Penicillium pulvis]KAJ5803696.1 Phosphatidylinositol Kinase [Penicillium pulvis]